MRSRAPLALLLCGTLSLSLSLARALLPARQPACTRTQRRTSVHTTNLAFVGSFVCPHLALQPTLHVTLEVQLPVAAASQPSALSLELWSGHTLLAPARDVLLLPHHMSAVCTELCACVEAEQRECNGAGGEEAAAGGGSCWGSRQGAGAFVVDMGVWFDLRAQERAVAAKAAGNVQLGVGQPSPRRMTQSTCTMSSSSAGAAAPSRAPSRDLPPGSGVQLRPTCCGAAAGAEGPTQQQQQQQQQQQHGNVDVAEGGSNSLSWELGGGAHRTAGAQPAGEGAPLSMAQALGCHLLAQAVLWGMRNTAEALLQDLLEELPFARFANGLAPRDVDVLGGAVQVDSLLSAALRSGSAHMLAAVMRWGQVYGAAPAPPHAPPSAPHAAVWDWRVAGAQSITPLCCAQAATRSQPELVELLLEDVQAGPSLLAAWLEQLPPPGSHTHCPPEAQGDDLPAAPPMSLTLKSQAGLRAGAHGTSYLLLLLCCAACGFSAGGGKLERATVRACARARVRSSMARDRVHGSAAEVGGVGPSRAEQVCAEADYQAWRGQAIAPTVHALSGGWLCLMAGYGDLSLEAALRHTLVAEWHLGGST